MTTMVSVTASALMLLVALGACATRNGKPSVIDVDVIEFESTVEAIDTQKRTVTLKSPDGLRRTFTVGQEVRDSDRIKPGDTVKVEIVDEVALLLREASEPPEAVAAAAAGAAPKARKPGLVIVDPVQVSADVEAIDYQKRTITLKGPRGGLVTYRVDDNVKRLGELKKGDRVVLRATEALAIVVIKP